MFFSDQGIKGFRSLLTISEAKGEMNLDKQPCSMVQEGIADRDTFLNFLFQASERMISPQSGNGQEGAQIREEQTKKELLNIIGTEFKGDSTTHSEEIPMESNISDFLEHAGNIPCDTNAPEMYPIIPGESEDLQDGNQESYVKPFLSQTFNLTTEHDVQDHIELVSKDVSMFEGLENQTRAIPDTENRSREDLRTFLKQVLLISKNVHDMSHTEIISGALSTAETVEAQAAVKHQTQEPLTDGNLRQLVNSSRELKYKLVVKNEKSNDALKFFTEKNVILQPGGPLLKNITVNSLDNSLQALTEIGQTTPNPVFQFLPALDNPGATNNLTSQIKQAAMVFDKDSYSVDRNVLGQVVARLFTSVREGSQNMIIHLYPPQLGKVKVRIVSDKGDLNVRLHSMNHQVVGILEKYLPLLQQSLEDQGIVLSDLQVSVESGDQEESQCEEQEIWSANPKITTPELSEEEKDTGIFQENIGWSRSSQGLSLRV
jgi:hypothetical protein